MSLCNDVLKYIKFRADNPIPGRHAHPAGARLAAGDEARRRGVAHHQLHVGQCAHPAQGLLDQGNRGEVARDAGERAHAPDQLLQLPDEMRGDHLGTGAAHLHDEVLLQAHLHHGGLFGPGFRLQDRAARHRIRRGRILGAAGHGLRARAARGRHPHRRGFPGHAGRRRGAVLLAARPDRPARRHRRRAGRRRLLGGQAHRQGRGEVRPQHHQEARAAAAQARHAQSRSTT